MDKGNTHNICYVPIPIPSLLSMLPVPFAHTVSLDTLLHHLSPTLQAFCMNAALHHHFSTSDYISRFELIRTLNLIHMIVQQSSA